MAQGHETPASTASERKEKTQMQWEELLKNLDKVQEHFYKELADMPNSILERRNWGFSRLPVLLPASVVAPIRFEGEEFKSAVNGVGVTERNKFNAPMIIGLNGSDLWICKASEKDFSELSHDRALDCSLEKFKDRFIILSSYTHHIPTRPTSYSDFVDTLAEFLSPGSFRYVSGLEKYSLELSHVEHAFVRVLEDLIQSASDFFKSMYHRATTREASIWTARVRTSALVATRDACEESRSFIGPSKFAGKLRVRVETSLLPGYEYVDGSFLDLKKSLTHLYPA